MGYKKSPPIYAKICNRSPYRQPGGENRAEIFLPNQISLCSQRNGEFLCTQLTQKTNHPRHFRHGRSLARYLSLLYTTHTEKFYTEVQEKILARYNKTFDWSLKAKMMGRKAIEAARVFVEESGISDSLSAEQFLVEREEMLQELFPTSELMPGADRLLRHLHAKGVPIALATGSHKRHFELKTQRHGELFALMHHVVLGDDLEVKQGKPSPDVFLAAAKRFEGGPADPSNVLVFEDAPSGVLAAKNAGMFVVMVPDPRLDKSFHDTADLVLNSLMDFNPSEWGLPPF
ncbi:(DL)-glycerol-3-phosphatase 2 isoform X1 [Arachis ipaensis]|uniref:(DL)-glycerol-3-phosphatase 2 isoform X1 n=1 Tax=Arachis ipaensis TaxID=130454 RepID=UPI000A2B43A9|nr:(DL)-glycerol-3-phosphatase 2 isoform X1 [Arachis ipaensis]XP_025630751.1 (DL)-glycerol-3-phosphatase 2 isoform X1 [Arachis hypogaea]